MYLNSSGEKFWELRQITDWVGPGPNLPSWDTSHPPDLDTPSHSPAGLTLPTQSFMISTYNNNKQVRQPDQYRLQVYIGVRVLVHIQHSIWSQSGEQQFPSRVIPRQQARGAVNLSALTLHFTISFSPPLLSPTRLTPLSTGVIATINWGRPYKISIKWSLQVIQWIKYFIYCMSVWRTCSASV